MWAPNPRTPTRAPDWALFKIFNGIRPIGNIFWDKPITNILTWRFSHQSLIMVLSSDLIWAALVGFSGLHQWWGPCNHFLVSLSENMRSISWKERTSYWPFKYCSNNIILLDKLEQHQIQHSVTGKWAVNVMTWPLFTSYRGLCRHKWAKMHTCHPNFV